MVLASRRERIYSQFPEPVSGYELDPERGYFSVILPEATTNLVTNPSVEGGITTNYTTYNGAMAAIATWQAHGAYGLQLTPAVSTESGFFYGGTTPIALTINVTYTASVTIQGEEGKIYYIWFASTAGALVGTKRPWIGTGHKQRIWVTTVEPAGANRRIYVTRDGKYTDQNLFYADGLQVEEKAYPTTYCDGDQVGFVLNEVAYSWDGTPRASKSIRSAQTRAGGREVNLLDLGIRVLAILGLGMAPLVDQALPMPGRGELAQGTGTQAREFTLVSALYADGPGPRHLQALRSGLIDAFKPDLVTTEQPLILRYQACDDEGDPLGESLDIVCKYRSGLEGNWDNHQQERVALNFKMHLPLIQNTYDSGAVLGYQTTVADADYIFMRTSDGIWQAMAGGMNANVYTIAVGPDGSVYAGGNFTLAGGVANTAYIAKWNGSAWSPLGRGADGAVIDIKFDAAGNLYAGGAFTHVHTSAGADVANTSKIAKWDGSVWSALGTGMNGNVQKMVIASDGTLYAGGAFTLAGGVADTVYIAKWDGATWAPLGTGMTGGPVEALAVDSVDNLYAGGEFTGAGGIANTGYFARWNGVTWASMNVGTSITFIDVIAFGPDTSLYIGGSFTAIGGVAAIRIARWNGATWLPLSTGMNLAVYDIKFDKSGNLYAAGLFTVAGGINLPDRMAVWNRSTWLPVDVDLPGAPDVNTLAFDALGNLYVGFDTAGSAISATVNITGIGSATAYPIFYLTGPGTIWQIKNYTTGKSIFFDLTLLAGETAILNLNPANPSFISSFRGSLWNTILPGSTLNFPLLPGNNNISAYFFGSTTAATAIVMTWRGQYWSLDGAAWK